MARVLVGLVALGALACTGGTTPEAPDAANASSEDAGPRVVRPVPALGEVCLEGWCFEEPSPFGVLGTIHAIADDDVWGVVDLAAAGRVFHFDGAHVSFAPMVISFVLTSPVRFASSASDDVWMLTSYERALWHFDGTAWAESTPPAPLDTIATRGGGGVWALGLDGTPYEWTGAAWLTHPLPDALMPVPGRGPRVVSLATAPDETVLLGIEVRHDPTGPDAGLPYATAETWEWNGTELVPSRVPPFAGPIYAFAHDDVWLGASHWDGSTLTSTTSVPGLTVVGGTSDDVWALASGVAYEYRGGAWSESATPHPVLTLSPSSPTAWAVVASGLLAYFDGSAWHELTTPSPSTSFFAVADAPAASPAAVWALASDDVGSVVLARAVDGRWSPIEATRGGRYALRDLYVRAPDDVWAWGTELLHFTGGPWTSTPDIPGIGAAGVSDLCATDASHAYATFGTDIGNVTIVAAWNGSWSSFGRVDGGSWSGFVGGELRCGVRGTLWAIAGPSIAERVGDGWRATPPFESLYTSELFAPAPDAVFGATARGLIRFDGQEWTLDSLDVLDPPFGDVVWVEAIAGSSRSDVSFVAGAQRGSTGPTGPRSIVHHDGTHVDRHGPFPSAERILAMSSLGYDDVLVIDVRGAIHRVTGGVVTSLGGTLGVEVFHAALPSPTSAWAVVVGGLEHFDGSAWSPVADPGLGTGVVIDVVAASVSDVWVLTQSGVAHFDGVGWTNEPLAAASSATRLVLLAGGEVAVLAGLSIWLRSGGSWTERALASAEDRLYRVDTIGGSSDDLWVAGAHAPTGSILPWFYHHDGTSLAPYRAPTYVSDLREIDGHLYARGRELWERVGGRWIPRDDLDPDVVFTRPAVPLPGAQVSSGNPTLWAVGAATVLRRDP